MGNSDYISFHSMPSKFSLLQAKQSQLSNMVLRRKRQADTERETEAVDSCLVSSSWFQGRRYSSARQGHTFQFTRSLRPRGYSERGEHTKMTGKALEVSVTSSGRWGCKEARECRLWTQADLLPESQLPISSCMTLGKLYDFSGSQFLPLKNVDDNTYL